MTDPYTVLGLSSSATQTEIAHAYRCQLRNYHPDSRSSESTSGADERLRQILAAYRLLRDPQRRSDYDRRVAGPQKEDAPTRITLTLNDSALSGAVLWAGPVRWYR